MWVDYKLYHGHLDEKGKYLVHLEKDPWSDGGEIGIVGVLSVLGIRSSDFHDWLLNLDLHQSQLKVPVTNSSSHLQWNNATVSNLKRSVDIWLSMLLISVQNREIVRHSCQINCSCCIDSSPVSVAFNKISTVQLTPQPGYCYHRLTPLLALYQCLWLGGLIISFQATMPGI